MSTGVVVYSKTAATNASADSAQNWAESQAPSSVNDSARAGMASVAKWRDDLNGTVVTGGTTTAYTATSNQTFAALTAGYEITFQINASNTGTCTLAVDSLTAKPLRPAAGVEFVAGALKIGAVYRASYFTSNSGEWIVHGQVAALPTTIVATASIADKAVTYAKIQDVSATNRLLGRVTALAGVTEEITIGGGLLVTSTTLSAPAFPPSGAFKNLVIKVASNTTVTVTADFVTTTDGTNYQTTAVSSTVNLGTTGVDALDTGSIAIDTFYALHVIAKSDGTTKVVASTSATAPTMPATYTYKARVGWVQTIHGSATLYGTWQFGREAQYVVGLAQTAALLQMDSGNKGSPTVPTWQSVATTRFVPTTASEIDISLYIYNSSGAVAAAPNNGYGAISSSSNPPPIFANGGGVTAIYTAQKARLLLESSNIYWAGSAGASGILMCTGWVDNI